MAVLPSLPARGVLGEKRFNYLFEVMESEVLESRASLMSHLSD